ncbi:TipJ family phage tail tip protein, partial [Dongia deserti]|uniref:TipJ family phage tail tip protein n=1 Tax=Dongia deserti TaxID=2268030 RepID=UPI0025465DCA
MPERLHDHGAQARGGGREHAPDLLQGRLQPLNAEVIAPDDQSVQVVAQLRPFTSDLTERLYPAGTTLAEILDDIQPNAVLRRCAHVSIDGDVVPREILHRVRPKPGHLVNITTVPQLGGGKKNPLRFILQLVVLAASILVPALLPASITGAVIFGAGATAFTVGSAIGAAIFGIGSLLVNAFIPAPTPKLKDLSGTSGRDSPTLAIQGIKNRANPYGVVPRLYGKMRITPYYGAKPFTEIRGKDTYLRILFDLGYGPLKLSDFRIGKTAIDDFQDVKYEYRQGFPDDEPLTLYTRIPEEEGLNILLKFNEWQQRTTEPDADEISIDFSFFRGLAAFDSSGDKQPQTVEFDIEYRTTDTGGGPGPWQSVTKPVAFGVRETKELKRPSVLQPRNDRAQPRHQTTVYRVSLDHISGKIAIVSGSSIIGAEPANPYRNKPICKVTVSSDTSKAYQLVDERDADYVAAGHFVPTLIAGGSGGRKVQMSAGTVNPPDFIVTDNSTAVVRANRAWKVDRGQYDVQVKRLTADASTDNVFNESHWTALRTFTDEAPVTAKGHALFALEIRATDQLNGVVDEFNCIAEAILADYDVPTGEWIDQPTSNVAAAYTDILMGSANRNPVDGSRIYWPEIEAWAAEGREFNAYLDFRQSVFDALR